MWGASGLRVRHRPLALAGRERAALRDRLGQLEGRMARLNETSDKTMGDSRSGAQSCSPDALPSDSAPPANVIEPVLEVPAEHFVLGIRCRIGPDCPKASHQSGNPIC